ncbi:hypothetical protein FRN05_17425 [Salmonella enterica subsp. enterica]|uniref:NlpC/P60 domain-containing protein n=1 Tax=Salmonella enterica TaxID=28901 RepID=A0A747KB93_SALER|nr:hypothetical protein [Salmonella enterica subsp. enterica serovar Ank]ECD2968489.1 hypothetical protein [Salmonella enterica subsp. enterica]ECK7391423.1 hypothetical protein [Salmonella enterica subsp. enterica serovar Meleagridis]EKE2788439.1 C40 family peptidase [Salmonella enterica]MJU51673.1 hypothetical protein [Salmonella enterica subsp. enterica serovar Coquilhatville]
MTKDEFIRRAVGLPWVDRACNWRAMDCWGVVVMYFRYVYGEELPCVEGYSTGERTIIDGFQGQIQNGKWREVTTPSGDCIAFMLFKNGIASHVGVVVDEQYVLHAAGDAQTEGQVRCDRLDLFRRFHRGEMRFYRYEGCRCW